MTASTLTDMGKQVVRVLGADILVYETIGEWTCPRCHLAERFFSRVPVNDVTDVQSLASFRANRDQAEVGRVAREHQCVGSSELMLRVATDDQLRAEWQRRGLKDWTDKLREAQSKPLQFSLETVNGIIDRAEKAEAERDEWRQRAKRAETEVVRLERARTEERANPLMVTGPACNLSMVEAIHRSLRKMEVEEVKVKPALSTFRPFSIRQKNENDPEGRATCADELGDGLRSRPKETKDNSVYVLEEDLLCDDEGPKR